MPFAGVQALMFLFQFSASLPRTACHTCSSTGRPAPACFARFCGRLQSHAVRSSNGTSQASAQAKHPPSRPVHISSTGKITSRWCLRCADAQSLGPFKPSQLNASDDRGIDVVRDQIKTFASTRTVFKSVLSRHWPASGAQFGVQTHHPRRGRCHDQRGPGCTAPRFTLPPARLTSTAP